MENSTLNWQGSRVGLSCYVTAFTSWDFSIQIRQAEIGKIENEGYYLTDKSGGTDNSEYIHNTRVDGDDTYGSCWRFNFPLRHLVGGNYDARNIVYGSRALVGTTGTAYASPSGSNS